MTDDDEVGRHLARFVDDGTAGSAAQEDRLDDEVATDGPEFVFGGVEGSPVDTEHGLLGLDGVGRRGQRPGHAKDLGAARGDADDPDAAAIVPGQGGNEIEGTVGGCGPIDRQQDAHLHDLLRAQPAPRARQRHGSNGPKIRLLSDR